MTDKKLLGFQEILCISLSWLVESKLTRKFLSSEGNWERIFAWVWKWDLTNFNSVIRKEVMNDVCGTFESGIEFKDFSVILQELFFRVNFTTTKFFFKIFFHDSILFRDPFIINLCCPLIVLVLLRWSLWLTQFFIEFSCVLITVVKVDVSSVNGDGVPQSEIIRS